ncbi:MAG: tRNA guanosine(34) transglycosylase Tgt [Patescibacteria group bacterium]
MFEILQNDKDSRARAGIIHTSSGDVETPSYAIVGTHAEVRSVSPDQLLQAKTQLIIANTYHLWLTLGEKLDSFEGVHARMKLPNTVIMTDSGGFQVFSLGFGREHGVGKVLGGEKKKASENLTRITEEGVFFTDENGEHFLGPKLSMEIQKKLGADIIFAFDECTSPEHDYVYQKEALGRTHRWAHICLESKSKSAQKLYGIVQGGIFEDLRKESAKYIGALPFDGFGIGGSFGEKKMGEVLEWVIHYLPEEKPRHLLGIGKIEDLFLGVEKGIDTFDCVIPTREARHGSAWTTQGRIDLKKGRYKDDAQVIEHGCGCEACASGIPKKQLREMFKSKDNEAGTLVSIHNIFFFNTLMEKIRTSIKENRFNEFKNESLKKLT